MSYHPRLALVIVSTALASCQVTMTPKIVSGRKPLSATERAQLTDSSLASSLEIAQAESARRTPDLSNYNRAVARVLTELQSRTPVNDWSLPVTVHGKVGQWHIEFPPTPATPDANPAEWVPSTFQKVVVASSITRSGYDQEVTREAWGVPVILINEGRGNIVRERYFRPAIPFFMPGTAVLEFQPRGVVKLRMVNTFRDQKAIIAGRTRELSYDITAAIEMKLDNPFIKKGIAKGLFKPEQQLEDAGLFSIAPYDAGKRPVVFVHGLRSSPRIWKNAVNELYANPALSRLYQPVIYFYPTGLGVPASAADLRRRLNLYRDKWDPQHQHYGMNHMVLVGHSMGGLLTQMQVVDSGDQLQKAFFRKAIDDTRGITQDQRNKAKEALVFEHQPFISRVIFIAVPHQGAQLADSSFATMLRKLIQSPARVMGLANAALLQDRGLLNPKLQQYKLLGMRSVETLSPKHPYFDVLKTIPLQCPWHSIIGDRARGDSPHSSDGYVPYTSSHYPVASSECIVPYPHSCTDKSETVKEVMRILNKHRSS